MIILSIKRHVFATIHHNEYEEVLWNKKCLRDLMNRIESTESKDHRTGTFEINKISLSWFSDKIYIQDNGCDGLAFGYQS